MSSDGCVIAVRNRWDPPGDGLTSLDLFDRRIAHVIITKRGEIHLPQGENQSHDIYIGGLGIRLGSLAAGLLPLQLVVVGLPSREVAPLMPLERQAIATMPDPSSSGWSTGKRSLP